MPIVFDETLFDIPAAAAAGELPRLLSLAANFKSLNIESILARTEKLCDSIKQDPEWRKLNTRDRIAVYIAALFHDLCSFPGVNPFEGEKIQPLLNSEISVKCARRILYEQAMPFDLREFIAGLIRWHKLPLNLHKRRNPQMSIIQASQSARNDLLAMLSRADVLSRMSPNTLEEMELISDFSMFCEHEKCRTAPYPFPSVATRYCYLNRPGYEAEEPVEPPAGCEAVVMSGLPGTNRFGWIQAHLPGFPVIAPGDAAELTATPEKAGAEKFNEARERAVECVKSGTPFVWDAPNVSRQLRAKIIDPLTLFGAKVRIVYLEMPYAEWIRMNAESSSPISESMQKHWLDWLDVPAESEAHAVEYIIRGQSCNSS